MTIMLVGLGVIGSFVAPLVARTAQNLVLIDRDTVEDRNCRNQIYTSDMIGMPKVAAMAAKLRSIWPAVSIDTYHADLADVPMGVYSDASIVFAGLDSLLARQSLGEIAYRLGKPWIDGGTADTSLGRVSFYAPGPACVECCFTAAHYRQLAMEYPCGASTAARVSPTAASGALGTTVAGLMASVYEQYVATADEPA
ncbi:MAG: ThiF family adenylyltransferase, partial [Planctomycetaceae bacterium]|nr:ThiF family adenylyltransferase [Planctomycetaceae bacterium]